MIKNCLSSLKFYKNFLDDDEVKESLIRLSSSRWGFQISSQNDNYIQNIFLHMDLSDVRFFTVKIFNKIQEVTKQKFELIRVYANGQFYGMPGAPHYDDKESIDRFTFLIYVNTNWDIIYGGQTVFMNTYFDANKNKEVVGEGIYTQYPVPKLGVLFPSNILHFAESPTKFCHDLRMTVAYKLEKIK